MFQSSADKVVLTLGLIALTCFGLGCFFLLKICLEYRRLRHRSLAKTSNVISPDRLQAIEDSLETKVVTDHHQNDSSSSEKEEKPQIDLEDNMQEDPCQICLDPFNVGDLISCSSVSNCRHEFHYQCISEWLKKKSTCPTCRESFIQLKKT